MALILNVDYWPVLTVYSCAIIDCDREVYGVLQINETEVEFFCFHHFFTTEKLVRLNYDKETWDRVRITPWRL